MGIKEHHRVEEGVCQILSWMLWSIFLSATGRSFLRSATALVGNWGTAARAAADVLCSVARRGSTHVGVCSSSRTLHQKPMLTINAAVVCGQWVWLTHRRRSTSLRIQWWISSMNSKWWGYEFNAVLHRTSWNRSRYLDFLFLNNMRWGESFRRFMLVLSS